MIHEIMRKTVVNPDHPLSPCLGIRRQPLAYRFLQREIHYRRQMRVESVPVRISALPVCKLRYRRSPALSHYIESGIFFQNGSAPFAHGLLLIVRVSVYPETVQTGIFYPPYGPLLEILQYERIVQIHVRHGRHEPSAFLKIQVVFRCIRIHIRGKAYIRPGIFRKDMHPVLERQVLHPPVRGTAMVSDNIHYDFKSFFMSFPDKFPIKTVRSESRVNTIIVGAGIAVV